MLVVSFIRHGESLDNLRSVWAGHKDAELSELGVRQAKALGDAYVDTRVDAIVTSDLKRAHATAVALLDSQPEPKPSFKVDHDLREQCFGDAEGHRWLMRRLPNKSLADHFKDGQYPVLFDRNDKFPNGESLQDLAARAERAISNLVLKPYLPCTASSGKDIHVVVVSHGLCISEMVAALVKHNDDGAPTKDYTGLQNTAWTRVTVQIKPGGEISLKTNELEHLPRLIVTVTDVNRREHTTNVKRQKGVVEHDPTQRSIREFFGGAHKPSEAEHAQSSAAGREEHN